MNEKKIVIDSLFSLGNDMTEIAHSFEEQVAEAALEPDSGKRRKLAAKARKSVAQIMPKRKQGAPTKFNQSIADKILNRVSSGETLSKVVAELGLNVDSIYDWMKLNPSFAESYDQARQRQAKSLVDKMIEETAGLTSDQALAARVRSDVIKWVASKFAPRDFGDTKRIELSGEVHHKHTHELSDDQKRRIAESWLISKEPDTPRITATTTGPDLEAVAVRSICEGEQGEHPKRKRSAQDRAKVPGKGKRPKLTVDSIVE